MPGLSTCCCIPQDRAYTVPELAELVRGAGLEIAAFIEPWRYDPASYLTDPSLLHRLERLDPIARAGLRRAAGRQSQAPHRLPGAQGPRRRRRRAARRCDGAGAARRRWRAGGKPEGPQQAQGLDRRARGAVADPADSADDLGAVDGKRSIADVIRRSAAQSRRSRAGAHSSRRSTASTRPSTN